MKFECPCGAWIDPPEGVAMSICPKCVRIFDVESTPAISISIHEAAMSFPFGMVVGVADTVHTLASQFARIAAKHTIITSCLCGNPVLSESSGDGPAGMCGKCGKIVQFDGTKMVERQIGDLNLDDATKREYEIQQARVVGSKLPVN